MAALSAVPTLTGSPGLGRNALCTARMRLVPSSARHVRADLEGPESLSRELGATVPADWPPEIAAEDRPTLGAMLEADASLVGWLPWYWVARDTPTASLVGFGGFGGRPEAGRVDLAYAVVPGAQRRGYATEAVGALVAWAFGSGRVRRVDAETLPHLTASVAVLKGNGFAQTSEATGTAVMHFSRVAQA